jgi:hypothetical protein
MTYLVKLITIISSLAIVIIRAVNKYLIPAMISITYTDTKELGIKL